MLGEELMHHAACSSIDAPHATNPFDTAVRQGFEPWVPFKGHNALAKRRFRPLSHLTFEWRNVMPRVFPSSRLAQRRAARLESAPMSAVRGPFLFRLLLVAVLLTSFTGCGLLGKRARERKAREAAKQPVAPRF